MPTKRALDQAIQLLLIPSSARMIQAAPLPADIEFLLRVLARDPEAEFRATELTGKPIETVREAAEFYADQVLFAPQASAYRALGAEPGAARRVLREHMTLLIRWLHPDSGITTQNAGHFDRVTRAWDMLRSDQGRDAYDRKLLAMASQRAGAARPERPNDLVLFRTSQKKQPNGAAGKRSRRSGRLRRVVGLVAIGVALVLLWIVIMQPAWLGSLVDLEWVVGADGPRSPMTLVAAAHIRMSVGVCALWTGS